jgi:hypothetical protein
MTRDRSFTDKLRQWDQLAVIALVVVAAEVAGTCWLERNHPDAIPAAVAVDPGLIDDDMERLIRRAALENGMDPDQLPSMRVLAAQVGQVHATTGDLDVADRGAVQQALISLVGDLAALAAPPGGSRAPGGRPQPGGEGQAHPKPMGGDSSSSTGNRLAPSIERIDELRAMRLGELASARGLDPATLLPSTELRQAAIASGSADSDESKALQQAYREIFSQLESSTPPAADTPAQP